MTAHRLAAVRAELHAGADDRVAVGADPLRTAAGGDDVVVHGRGVDLAAAVGDGQSPGRGDWAEASAEQRAAGAESVRRCRGSGRAVAGPRSELGPTDAVSSRISTTNCVSRIPRAVNTGAHQLPGPEAGVTRSPRSVRIASVLATPEPQAVVSRADRGGDLPRPDRRSRWRRGCPGAAARRRRPAALSRLPGSRRRADVRHRARLRAMEPVVRRASVRPACIRSSRLPATSTRRSRRPATCCSTSARIASTCASSSPST